ncbi:winged helix-turn-helix domain-containing protein [Croceibacter atlanticus]|uniref:winged helix-turn-helix domain-containing protein n=1 Tax=Croceibacter atlanticus TaxID=313588 RepID=UPI0030F5220F
MKFRYHYFILFTATLFLLLTLSCSTKEKPEVSSGHIKVALRSVGHQLLLLKNDSTSLVKPIEQTNATTYKLSFERSFQIDPEVLNATIDNVFKSKLNIHNYLVEVVDCTSNEVAYSYVTTAFKDEDIVPCSGRVLPNDCYTILVMLTEIPVKTSSTKTIIFYILVTLVLAFLVLVFYSKYASYKREQQEEQNTNYIGHFKFYPDQLILVKEAEEIQLSNKECELLALFVAKPNEVIKREELTKKVWEDNGVVVGRSLDTYISKLRKKLASDASIQLINVHGVGYKLVTN